LQLQTPTSTGIGSSNGHSSGSEKKYRCTIERSINVIDLSDSEFDTEDDEQEPNAKKPLVAVDNQTIGKKAIVTVKVEKDVSNDAEKSAEKDVENDAVKDEEPK
nr:hypothetical protein [Tanacetum cinerariifolium]